MDEIQYKGLERRLAGFNLTKEDAREIWDHQKGLCGICSKPLNFNGTGGSVIDHCHSTNRVRGFLCTGCNARLGLYENMIKGEDQYKDYLDNSLQIGYRNISYTKTYNSVGTPQIWKNKRCSTISSHQKARVVKNLNDDPAKIFYSRCYLKEYMKVDVVEYALTKLRVTILKNKDFYYIPYGVRGKKSGISIYDKVGDVFQMTYREFEKQYPNTSSLEYMGYIFTHYGVRSKIAGRPSINTVKYHFVCDGSDPILHLK